MGWKNLECKILFSSYMELGAGALNERRSNNNISGALSVH